MADLAEKKTVRANQKRKVTKGINKLKSSLHYCTDHDLLKEKADILENDYDKLYDLHEECRELGTDEEDYMEDTTNSFQECMKLYFSSGKAEEERKLLSKQNKEAAPLKSSIERDFSRVEATLEKIQTTLGLDSNEVKDCHVLEVREDLTVMSAVINTLLDSVNNLSKVIEDNAELETKVSSLMHRTDRINRDVRVFISTFQKESFQHPVSSLSKEVIPTSPSDQKVQVSVSSHPSSTPLLASAHVGHIPILNPQATSFLPSASTGSPTSVVTATQTKTSSQVASTPVKSMSDVSNAQESVPDSNSASIPSQMINSSQGSFQNFSRDTIHTKRSTLPVFSGNRADWQEFKAVWKSMAEKHFKDPLQLAMELKKCCRGKAAERVKHIFVTHDQAYKNLWSRLEEEYEDTGLCVQSALSYMVSLKPVASGDYGALVRFVDSVEGVHSQLKELNQLDAVHTVDVDRMNMLLPRDTSLNWLRKYRALATEEKLKPFSEFVAFLKTERSIVARLVDYSPILKAKERNSDLRKVSAHNTKGEFKERTAVSKTYQKKKPANGCIFHPDSMHPTETCRNLLKMSVKQKYEELKKERRCFRCFKGHPRSECMAKACKCGKNHHASLCYDSENRNDNHTGTNTGTAQAEKNEDQDTLRK